MDIHPLCKRFQAFMLSKHDDEMCAQQPLRQNLQWPATVTPGWLSLFPMLPLQHKSMQHNQDKNALANSCQAVEHMKPVKLFDKYTTSSAGYDDTSILRHCF